MGGDHAVQRRGKHPLGYTSKIPTQKPWSRASSALGASRCSLAASNELCTMLTNLQGSSAIPEAPYHTIIQTWNAGGLTTELYNEVMQWGQCNGIDIMMMQGTRWREDRERTAYGYGYPFWRGRARKAHSCWGADMHLT